MCPQFEIVSYLQSSHPGNCEDLHVLNNDIPKGKDKFVQLVSQQRKKISKLLQHQLNYLICRVAWHKCKNLLDVPAMHSVFSKSCWFAVLLLILL